MTIKKYDWVSKDTKLNANWWQSVSFHKCWTQKNEVQC